MIVGIPYFGHNTQRITEQILVAKVSKELEFDSLYLLVKNFMYKRVIVVIDNMWLTWLNDIQFNYRDKQCYLPYFTYELHKDDSKKYRSDNNGHLILFEESIYVRYNYKYEKINLNLNNLSLILYDLDTNEKFMVNTNKWFNAENFSLDKLYELYLDSCFKEDDYLYNWGGDPYHRIFDSNKYYKNKEKALRNLLDLPHIKYGSDLPINYRDVRQYKQEEVIAKIGIRDTKDSYRLRKLKFESYLYCVLRQECVPEEQVYLRDWNSLTKNKDYIKIGKNIKLIIKSYWLNNHKPVNRKSWSRI